MEGRLTDIVSEFKQREFIAWYEEHVTSSLALDADLSDDSYRTFKIPESLESSKSSLQIGHDSSNPDSSDVVIESPIKALSSAANSPAQGSLPELRNRAESIAHHARPSQTLIAGLHISGPSQLFSSPPSSCEDRTLIKRSPNSSQRSIAKRLDSTAIETQSTLFSDGRWQVSNVVSSGPSPSTQGSKRTKNLDDDSVNRCSEGWDAKWTDQIPLLQCTLDENAALLHQALQSVINESFDEASYTVTTLKLGLSETGNSDERLAPAVYRLRRRLIHRSSQPMTQTVAAPISTLEWIARTKYSANSALKHCAYGKGRSGIGGRIGECVLERNGKIPGKMLSLPRQYGWMHDYEHGSAIRLLEMHLESFQGRYVLEPCLVQTFYSSIDCFAYVDDTTTAEAMGEMILKLPNCSAEIHAFKAGAMPYRVFGTWKPCERNLDWHIIVDVKFIIKCSNSRWMIEEFYRRPAEQIKQILVEMLGESCTDQIKREEYGFNDFVLCVETLMKTHQISSWNDVLRAIANEDQGVT